MKFVLLIATCLLLSYAESAFQYAPFGGYACVDGFCLNGGTCVDHPGSAPLSVFSDATPSYATCNCATGFKGAVCEHSVVTDCLGNSAPDVWVGDGICQKGNAKYEGKFIDLNCVALDFDGGDCATPATPNNHGNCGATTCGTGKCYGSDTKHWCSCPRNSAGGACQVTVDGCSTSPCMNGARCITDITESYNYKCVCAGGYSGKNCTTAPSSGTGTSPTCASGCSGHGLCYFLNTCACYTGYYGSSDCVASTACNSSPCQNGGTCKTSSSTDSYTCTCASGYDGTNCQTAIPVCMPEPCQHTGTCLRNGLSYNCKCSTDYRGLNCSFGLAGFDCATTTYQATMFPPGWISDSVCEHQYTYITSQFDFQQSRYNLIGFSCGAAGDHDCPSETSAGVRFTFSVLSFAFLLIAYAHL